MPKGSELVGGRSKGCKKDSYPKSSNDLMSQMVSKKFIRLAEIREPSSG